MPENGARTVASESDLAAKSARARAASTLAALVLHWLAVRSHSSLLMAPLSKSSWFRLQRVSASSCAATAVWTLALASTWVSRRLLESSCTRTAPCFT